MTKLMDSFILPGGKQGDPLSLFLFILAAEVLSRGWIVCFQKKIRNYGLPKWSETINHLSYSNDTIIFSSAYKYTLNLIMEIV